MKNPECIQCREKPGARWVARKCICQQCKKEVEKVLDLHHTNANLCSLECERMYWLDIWY